MRKKLLILTNMGPKPSAPFQGQFVRNQVDALAALDPAYFFMRWHNDSALNRRFKYPILWLQFIWQWIFSFKTLDIIHVHYFYPTIWLALTYRWLRNPRVKIVVTCHGSDIYLYKPESALYKFAAAKVDHFIFTSAALQQKFFRQDISAEVLPAGIHPTFGDTKQRERADKDIDVLFVGTLDFNKGLDRLLALLPQLPALQFAVVGAGPYRAQLEQAAEQYANLQLLSPQSPQQLKTQFERSKCFISLSRNESFGLVMTEAMACYTPVIATDTDGAKAQVRHGQNGYCIEQLAEADVLMQLVGSIQRLLSLPTAEYQQLQQQAFADSRQYLVTTVAQRLTALYNQLM